MRVLTLSTVTHYHITTDEIYFNRYRRPVYGGEWECLMGESWESVYSQEDELNKALKEFMNTEVNNEKSQD